MYIQLLFVVYFVKFQIRRVVMNVKPQIFQATKQTILKNKQEFIEIQLQQVKKRIGSLKIENSKLKDERNQLKAKSNVSGIGKLSLTCRDNVETNKENKCINLAKKKRYGEIEAISYRQIGDKNAEAERQTELQKQFSEQLTQIKANFDQQQQQRQRELLYLQDYIKVLKTMWQEKQKTIQIQQSQLPIPKSINIVPKANANASKYYTSKPPQNMVGSVQTLNESQINQHDESLNRSNDSRMTQDIKFGTTSSSSKNFFQEPRRKTMSVNLNSNSSSTGYLMGFNFGKKISKKQQLTQQSHQQPLSTDPRSSTSLSFLHNSTHNPSTHSTSILSHSNSRASMSVLSMSNSNAGSSKSKLNRTEASKSYAKIVTKLECKGCAGEFRPNQYYTHIGQCRQYLKVKLMEEKMRVEDQINQTLNLSISQSRF